jgi:hypothetical protein
MDINSQVPFLFAERARSEGASPGLMARLGVPVGGRVKKSRAVKGNPAIPSFNVIGNSGA